MPRLTQPLKWHGGKYYLAREIIKRFPPHTHYVEPFAGGLAVLFAKPVEWIEGHSEVVNDLNGELANFWAVLREPKWIELFRRLQFTEFSEWAWAESRLNVPRDSIMRAWAFFTRYRQSRQGLGRDFATLSKNRTRRGMNEQVASWLSAVEGLPEAHERLKRVAILNRDGCDVIKSEDSPNTFFYIDPPYVHETRSTTGEYQHEMTRDQHQEMLIELASIKGKFLLSGYPCELYEHNATDYGWHCDRIEIDNKASGRKVKERKIECLWRNYELPA